MISENHENDYKYQLIRTEQGTKVLYSDSYLQWIWTVDTSLWIFPILAVNHKHDPCLKMYTIRLHYLLIFLRNHELLPKKAMKSDNLYIRSGAYESLSYLYERLGNFEEAMKYNNLNIASEDSIRKMDDQRNIAQIEMRHENKKMAAKQFRMNTFIKVSFPVFILLIIVFLVMYRKLLKKRDAEIGSHKNTIQQIGLEKEKLELKIEQQNEIKKNLVKERNTLIKQLEITQKELDELYERKKTITVDEARIMLSRIKKTKKLTEQDWKNILVITQAIHDNFIDNFTGENPQLKKDDIKVCCLLKVGFTKKDIIELLDLSEDAMNKRMQRLKARMSIKKKWKKNELEQYISDF